MLLSCEGLNFLKCETEPECCDGSDEAPGVCPNKCEEIGKAYRAKVEAETKTRKTVCGQMRELILHCSNTQHIY